MNPLSVYKEHSSCNQGSQHLSPTRTTKTVRERKLAATRGNTCSHAREHVQPHEGAKRVRRRKLKTTPMFRQNNGVQMAKQRRCFRIRKAGVLSLHTECIKPAYTLNSAIKREQCHTSMSFVECKQNGRSQFRLNSTQEYAGEPKKAALDRTALLVRTSTRYETAMFFVVFFSSFVAFGMTTVRMPFSTLAEIFSLMTSSGSV